jgi:hypothetical protein
MDNFKLIKKTLIILGVITFFTVILLVLLGENGLINQEVEDYNDTHVEENSEKQKEKIVVVDNK